MKYDIAGEFDKKEFNSLGIEKAKKIMVIGPLDNGKTVLCRKLLTFFCSQSLAPVYFLDFDIGQSSIGPPCTIGSELICGNDLKNGDKRNYYITLGFIGSMYPYGIEEKIYKIMSLLLNQIPTDSVIVVDTTGFNEINQKVINFKIEKIIRLRPDVVIFIASKLRENQFLVALEGITQKIGCRLYIFPNQSKNLYKSIMARRAYHKIALNYWLENAIYLEFSNHLLNFQENLLCRNRIEGRIVGFIDSKGFCVGGGILIEKRDDNVTIYGKLKPGGDVSAIELGILKFNAQSKDYNDIKLNIESMRDLVKKGNYDLISESYN